MRLRRRTLTVRSAYCLLAYCLFALGRVGARDRPAWRARERGRVVTFGIEDAQAREIACEAVREAGDVALEIAHQAEDGENAVGGATAVRDVAKARADALAHAGAAFAAMAMMSALRRHAYPHARVHVDERVRRARDTVEFLARRAPVQRRPCAPDRRPPLHPQPEPAGEPADLVAIAGDGGLSAHVNARSIAPVGRGRISLYKLSAGR